MADNLRKYTTQEVLNKVYEDASGNTIGINAATSKETLNAALDESNSRLNVSLAGGTISGDVTITGDLTVNPGSSTYSYDEAVYGNVMYLDSEVAHGMTGLGLTNAYGSIEQLHSLNGGVMIRGMSDAAAGIGVQIYGTIGVTDPTDAVPAVEIRGSKKNSTTHQALAAAETVFQVGNLGTDLVTVLGSGYVGIGTESPTALLNTYVADAAPATSGSTPAGVGLRIGQDGGTNCLDFGHAGTYAWIQATRSADLSITTPLALNPNGGNVGIGESAPSTTLHLTNSANDATAPELRLQNTRAAGAGSDGDDAGTISFYAQDAGSNAEAMSTILSEVNLNTTGSTACKLTFKTMHQNSSTALLTLSGWAGGSHSSTVSSAVFNTSLVGIGQSSPDGKVHIESGSAGTIGTLAYADELIIENSGAVGISLRSPDANSGSISWQSATNDTVARIYGSYNSGNELLALETSGTERMILDDNSRISLSNNDSGTSNTVFGKSVGAIDSGTNYNVFIGEDVAGENTLADATQNTMIGYRAGHSLTSGDSNTIMGRQAGLEIQDGHNNTLIGMNAGSTTVLGGYLVAVGDSAMVSGAVTAAADGSVAVGASALAALTSGAGNLAIGFRASDLLSTGNRNIAIGQDAFGLATTTTSDNIAIGYSAMGTMNNTGSLKNVAIGNYALDDTGTNAQVGTVAIGYNALTALTSGGANTAVGYEALKTEDAGGSNVAIGYQSLTLCNNDTGANVAVGRSSGAAIVAGYSNTLVGNGAGSSLTGGTNNVLLGRNAQASAVGGINQIVLGKDTTGVADNSVTLGNADVDHVYAAWDSVDTAAGVVTGAILHAKDIATTDGVLKENLITNSGFDVWSNSTLENVGSDLITNGAFGSDASWNKQTGWTITSGVARASSSGAANTINQTLSGSPVVSGKLYRVIYTAVNYSGGSFRFDFGSTTGVVRSANGTYTEIFEGGGSSNVGIASVTTLTCDFDNISIYEVTPACIAANTVSLDGWKKSTNADLYREHNGSNTKDGSFYSLYIKPTVAGQTCDWPQDNNEPTHLARFAGRTVTFGCWMKSDNSSAGIYIHDNDAAVHGSHTGGGGWEWLEATKTLASDIDEFMAVIRGYGETYASQPMLVFGNSIGSGNYTRPQGEIVWFEATQGSNEFNNSTVGDTVEVKITADSDGVVPKGVKAVYATLEGKAAASPGSALYSSGSLITEQTLQIRHAVNGVNTTSQGWVPIESNGDFSLAEETPYTGVYLYYQGVMLQ